MRRVGRGLATAALGLVLASGCARYWSGVRLEEVATRLPTEEAPELEEVYRADTRVRVESPAIGPTVLAPGDRLRLRADEWLAGESLRWVPEAPAALTFSVEREDVPDGVAIGILVGVAIVAVILTTTLSVLDLTDAI